MEIDLKMAWLNPLTDADDGQPVAVRVAEICLVGRVAPKYGTIATPRFGFAATQPAEATITPGYTVIRLTTGDNIRVTESAEEILDRIETAVNRLAGL